jgi:hypothetical protein
LVVRKVAAAAGKVESTIATATEEKSRRVAMRGSLQNRTGAMAVVPIAPGRKGLPKSYRKS